MVIAADTDADARLLSAIGALQRVAGAVFEVSPEDEASARATFLRDWPPALANLRRELGLAPVPSAPFGYFQAPLRDGTTGYFQRHSDDCLQAAIASCCQIPPHLVPDLHLHDQRIAGQEPDEIDRAAGEQMDGWLAGNGLRLTRHPTPRSGARWIGVTVMDDGSAATHCLVMSGRDVLFDPGNLQAKENDEAPSWATWGDLDYGITIE